MPLTFGEIVRDVAQYAGRAGVCATSEEARKFAKQVMQYVLFSGSYSGIRQVDLCAVRGCISLPPEVETPLKVRICDEVANVWNRWTTFNAVTTELDDCPPAERVLAELGNYTPLAHPLPHGGSIIGVEGSCDESPEAYVHVQGADPYGNEIYTMFQGEQIPGERYQIQKGVIRHGQVKFGTIRAVVKSRTDGYAMLYAVDPLSGSRRFLAAYTPVDEKPLYKAYKLLMPNCPEIIKVSILARVKLKDNYHDNELTMFDNSLAMILAAQRIQAEKNNDVQVAEYKKRAVDDNLNQEAGYKKTANTPIAVFAPLSGRAIKNIIR